MFEEEEEKPGSLSLRVLSSCSFDASALGRELGQDDLLVVTYALFSACFFR